MPDFERIFNERDFSELMYNVYSVEEGTNLLAKFKGLASLPSFLAFQENWTTGGVYEEDDNEEGMMVGEVEHSLSRNKVIRYVIYAYDRNSPIAMKFSQDEVKRKTTAALYAGFEPNDEGYFERDVNDMMNCNINQVNAMIIDYVRQYNDPEYSLLVTGYESYYKKLNQIMADDSESLKRDAFQVEESKGRLFTQAKAMASDLDKLSTKILTDDNKLLKKDLYCIIDQRLKNKLNITPERLAGVS